MPQRRETSQSTTPAHFAMSIRWKSINGSSGMTPTAFRRTRLRRTASRRRAAHLGQCVAARHKPRRDRRRDVAHLAGSKDVERYAVELSLFWRRDDANSHEGNRFANIHVANTHVLRGATAQLSASVVPLI